MLHLHASDALAPLAARLAEVLREPPADPMAPDWVGAPSAGVQRWLSLELARHLGAGEPGRGDGVAANITYAFPGALRTKVLHAGLAQEPGPSGPGGEAAADPWSVERLAWSVLAVLAGAEADPLLRPILDAGRGSSLYGRARQVADLFDRYHLHRPEMVERWRTGQDVDAVLDPLRPSRRWQPHLWRLVRAGIGSPSPAERLPLLLSRLEAGDLPVDLPDRLSLFGLSVLPGGSRFLAVADAIAAHRQLHLFLVSPSRQEVERIRALARAKPLTHGVRQRSALPELDDVANPLLRSWARPPRETAMLLADAEPGGVLALKWVGSSPVGGASGEVGGAGGASMLAALQHTLRQARPPADLAPVPLDDSVQLHAAYGATRQVEALRDAILHLLADHPHLREEDVVVLCPSLERFAPLLEAGLGPAARAGVLEAEPTADGPPRLRYRIADRLAAEANPVIQGARALLELVGSRFESVAVLDFLGLPAVRQRYGFSDEDLGRLRDWVAETNVRWGLHPEHRDGHGVPSAFTANTWQAGLDRLLLGVAVDHTDQSFSLGDVVPLGVEGDDVGLVGRLADVLAVLGELADQVDRARPLEGWVALVREAIGRLLAPAREAPLQMEVIDRLLGEVCAEAEAGAEVALTYADVVRLLQRRLVEPAGRSSFFRGGITVSSFDPLRWVPFEVVCLLGMDQVAFGAPPAEGDDLTALQPTLGDRDPRAEGRQAILEAVLSAGSHLVVVRDGHDVRTNQEVPPAVVVAELRDAVAALAGREPGEVEVSHPRQAFDERGFDGGLTLPSGPSRPWSFDRGALVAARARRGALDQAAPSLLGKPHEPDPVEVVELAELHLAVTEPVRLFTEQVLGVHIPRTEDAPSALLPVAPDPLESWGVGDRLLRAHLSGSSLDQAMRVEQALGTLPPGVLGDAALDRVRPEVEAIAEQNRTLGVRPVPDASVAIDVTLAGGTRIIGAVSCRLDGDPGPARVGFSRFKAKHRLAAWVDLVALTVARPEVCWRSVVVQRGQSSSGKKAPSPVAVELVVPGGSPEERRQVAEEALGVAVDLWQRARREPIPLFPTVSEAVFRDAASSKDWDGKDWCDGRDRRVLLAFGEISFDEVMAIPASPDDPAGPGGRVARFARYLWSAVQRSCIDLVAERAEGAEQGDGPAPTSDRSSGAEAQR